jgi:hypothetical protein
MPYSRRGRPSAVSLAAQTDSVGEVLVGEDELDRTLISEKTGQFMIVVEILTAIIRNISVKRALHKICPEPSLSFWAVIYGNLMDMTVLEWCKLFGSDDEDRQPVHWKNVVADQDSFKSKLLAEVGMDTTSWLDYWNELKRYRDRCVAHHDPGRISIPNYPQLEPALLSAFVYYEYVRCESLRLGMRQQPADIREYARSFEAKCAEASKDALAATSTIEETDYERRGCKEQ